MEHGIIVHGCNCQGVMGSGVAGALRTKWPEIYESYKRTCNNFANRKEQLLGQIIPVLVTDPSCIYLNIKDVLILVNAFTQLDYGRDNKVYANVNAIKTALFSCLDLAGVTQLPIYLPPIGCGLGGLSFTKDVKPIIEQVAEQYPFVDIYVCDL